MSTKELKRKSEKEVEQRIEGLKAFDKYKQPSSRDQKYSNRDRERERIRENEIEIEIKEKEKDQNHENDHVQDLVLVKELLVNHIDSLL